MKKWNDPFIWKQILFLPLVTDLTICIHSLKQTLFSCFYCRAYKHIVNLSAPFPPGDWLIIQMKSTYHHVLNIGSELKVWFLSNFCKEAHIKCNIFGWGEYVGLITGSSLQKYLNNPDICGFALRWIPEIWMSVGFKGELHPKPKLSMFCALSQNNQLYFEKYLSVFWIVWETQNWHLNISRPRGYWVRE